MSSKTSEDSAITFDSIGSRGAQSPIRYTAAWIVALLLSDLTMFVLAAYFAGSLVDHRWDIAAAETRLWSSSFIFIAVWLGMFYFLGLYSRSFALSFRDEFYCTVIALIFGVTPQLVLFTLVPALSTSRMVLLLSTAIAIAFVGSSRSTIHLIRVAAEKQRGVDQDSVGQFRDRPAKADFQRLRLRICNPMARAIKRTFDIFFSSLVILICLPVMLIAGLLVWLESGRPIFFRQERVGIYGRTFLINKFRTMRADADSTWARPGDKRVTRIGAFLRRTSIDELPQLFNVLRGEMSLVGPRPEMRPFEESFALTIPSYTERRLALPGITGWAQVNMKRNLSPEDAKEVLSHDLFYIEHWSIFLDFTLLLKTIAEFLFHGAV